MDALLPRIARKMLKGYLWLGWEASNHGSEGSKGRVGVTVVMVYEPKAKLKINNLYVGIEGAF